MGFGAMVKKRLKVHEILSLSDSHDFLCNELEKTTLSVI